MMNIKALGPVTARLFNKSYNTKSLKETMTPLSPALLFCMCRLELTPLEEKLNKREEALVDKSLLRSIFRLIILRSILLAEAPK